MHELGIALEVLRSCRVQMGADGGQLECVTVAIGELSAVEPDLLRYAWDAATRGAPEEGAVLDVQWCPARQVCETCGVIEERVTGSWLRLCPRCAGPLRVEGGQELDLVRLEFVPNESPEGSTP